MSPDLTGLVTAARSGDRSAFDELVKATYTDMYTLAYRLTGNEEDARDVVQDAYLRAFRGLKRFRGDARFTTWMYRITANCASTHLAKRTRTRHDDLDDEFDLVDTEVAHDPERQAESGYERDRIAGALAELPPRLRAVIVLRDVEHSDRENGKRGGGGGDVWSVEARVREDQVQNGNALGDGERGNREKQKDERFEGGIEELVEVVEFFLESKAARTGKTRRQSPGRRGRAARACKFHP